MTLTTSDFIKGLARRLIYRFVTLPAYLFVFIPWIFVFLITQTSYSATHKLASFLAYLAGKPADAVLGGHDIIRIMAIVFFMSNLVFELFYLVTGRKQRWPFYKVEAITKALLIGSGWLLFLILVKGSAVMSVVFGMIGLALVGTEFCLIWFFTNARPSLPSQKIR